MTTTTLKDIKITTVNPMYDLIEDRIRLSFNHNDDKNAIDLMMTRNFFLQLLPSLEEYLYKVYDNKILDKTKLPHTKKRRLTNHRNLSSKQHNATLLEKIDFSFIRENKKTLVCFYTKEAKVYAYLTPIALVEIFSVIKDCVPYFEWSISPNM